MIIPIRVDTRDRTENCDAVLRYFRQNFPRCETILVEQDGICRTDELGDRHPELTRLFDSNPGPFSKSRAVNIGLLHSKRRYICIADTDILLDPQAIRSSLRQLSSGRRMVIIPFNQIVLDVSGSLRDELIERADVASLGRIRRLIDIPKDSRIKPRIVNGGIVIADRNVLIAAGGFNKKMASYGWEDTEFLYRIGRLGNYPFLLQEYNLIHLDHRRGPDSVVNSMYAINKTEFGRVKSMSLLELQRYVATDLHITPDGSEQEVAPVSGLLKRLVGLARFGLISYTINRVRVELQIRGARAFLIKAVGR